MSRIRHKLTGLLLIGTIVLTSCHGLQPQPMPDEAPIDFGPLANPLPVPMLSRDEVMDTVSDEVGNYFRIIREERVRLLEDILTEGWIETQPRIGATALEPWRRDSTPGFELAHATLQTVRRFARVRVIPAENSYLIDVKVYKELEDLPQPLLSGVSGKYSRFDNSIDIDNLQDDYAPRERGWIPMGRDYSLENTMLSNIQKRTHKLARIGYD
ncbi:MAG TPA: hypothetical protein PKD64_10690 [Pirellulaceae bacterium]|nr:hypothetical protein [Pirellulaceae bacterium]HMO92648.1 hypothetical protein [Pirellulaceae bacterium]HMP70204.1 hypothetical protein [Pirellulaceae bacterium]